MSAIDDLPDESVRPTRTGGLSRTVGRAPRPTPMGRRSCSSAVQSPCLSAAPVRRVHEHADRRRRPRPPKNDDDHRGQQDREPQHQRRLEDARARSPPRRGGSVTPAARPPRRPRAAGPRAGARRRPPPSSTRAPIDPARSATSRRAAAGRTTIAASSAAITAASRASWRSWIICLIASGTSPVGTSGSGSSPLATGVRSAEQAGLQLVAPVEPQEHPLRAQREVGGQRLVEDPEDARSPRPSAAAGPRRATRTRPGRARGARGRGSSAGAWARGPGRRAPSAARRR